jgi:peptidoglycan/xylan/chitin deacetylase (PgdA/CDA1 family)/spore germination protein YaaH/GT2 family glycosyltransferase
MKTILVDPTLSRARRLRFSVGMSLLLMLAIAAIFVRGLRPGRAAPPALRSPRKAIATRSARPAAGQLSGHRTARDFPVEKNFAPRAIARTVVASATGAPPRVIAFVEPSVPGARESLVAHADQIAVAAFTGLLVQKDGTVVDRIDPALLALARSRGLAVQAVLQNLDAASVDWSEVPLDEKGRARLIDRIDAACERHDLSGVHIDLEALGDWDGVTALVRELAVRLRLRGREVDVEVPALLDGATLARLGEVADRVVVMAYDEHDEAGPAGPIASEAFVGASLSAAAAAVPAGRLAAGLGIYGYDWTGEGGAPVSFVEAAAAAKEARTPLKWDPASGTATARLADEEGAHEVWLLDGASLWNQLAVARDSGISTVALWRLGGEDPGVWAALAGHAEGLGEVPAPDGVDNQGDGPFLALALSPEAGRRRIELRDGRITDEEWFALPSPYVVRRAGVVPGKVALTFDDGPDPVTTPAILDVLAARQAPAAFFVVGLHAARFPELVARIAREGHELGNHSFTHPDVDRVSAGRLEAELEATTRVVEGIAGLRPLLYRPPSLADVEPRTVAGAAAFARAGSLGYLVVDADVDPRDWQETSAARLTETVLREAAQGGVVLLHDGGADRRVTVEALPAIVDGLRARGLELVPVSQLIGKRRDEVMPPARPRTPARRIAEHAVFSSLGVLARVCGAALKLALALVVLRGLTTIGLALWSERRRRRRRRGPLPSVTVVIPAYNEGPLVARTVESVLRSDVPVDVLVIDDGSSDGTAARLRRRFGRDFRVRVASQANGGKARALRTGFAMSRSEVVVALDGDTLFARDTVRRLVEPMLDERVGAVAGTALVGNVENGLTAAQALEYLVQQGLERRAWDALDAVPIVPGAVGAWRRRAVEAAGGFQSDTLAEDADLAMALRRRGWKVVYAPGARAYTEAPSTVAGLVRQRRRWSFGVLQALWKHRRALIERRAGALGRVVLPSLVLFQLLLPLLMPFALVQLVFAAGGGRLGAAVAAWAILQGVELAQLAVALGLARAEAPLLRGWLWSLLVQRPVLTLVQLRALWRVLDGIPLGWGTLTRRNSVPAPCAARGVSL